MVWGRDDSNGIVPGVRKIAVLRANGLGDFIFTLPTLEALRAAYPQAEIALVGREWHAKHLRGRPGPWDRVICIPREGDLLGHPAGEAEQVALERFMAAMQAEGFDLAFQLYGGGRFSNPYLLRFGARLTVGLKSSDAIPLDRWIPYHFFQPEVFRFLEVAALVGAQPVGIEPRFAWTEADEQAARPYIPASGRPLVALQPGAGDPRRRWPVDKFAAVGDALAASGAVVAVTGAGADQPLVSGVVDSMRAPALNLCDALSLGGLAALFSHCAVVIGNDTGPTHLAAAVGAPTVTVFWAATLYNSGPVSRRQHRPVIAWRVDCPLCGTNTLETPCDHAVSFVEHVSVAAVLEQAMDLLAGRG